MSFAIGLLLGFFIAVMLTSNHVDQVWQFVENANHKRKKFQRLLKKEREAHMALSLTLAKRVAELRQENDELAAQHASLTEDVMGQLLVERDQKLVKSSLTRKVKKTS